MDVPIQFFQSVIAIELAIVGALLFQIRYFQPQATGRDPELRRPWLRLLVAVILGATLIGSLDAMVHGGGSTEAIAVTIGLALSMLPIIARVLPPLASKAHDGDRYTYSTVTVVGLALYAIAVVGLVLLLNR